MESRIGISIPVRDEKMSPLVHVTVVSSSGSSALETI